MSNSPLYNGFVLTISKSINDNSSTAEQIACLEVKVTSASKNKI